MRKYSWVLLSMGGLAMVVAAVVANGGFSSRPHGDQLLDALKKICKTNGEGLHAAIIDDIRPPRLDRLVAGVALSALGRSATLPGNISEINIVTGKGQRGDPPVIVRVEADMGSRRLVKEFREGADLKAIDERRTDGLRVQAFGGETVSLQPPITNLSIDLEPGKATSHLISLATQGPDFWASIRINGPVFSDVFPTATPSATVTAVAGLLGTAGISGDVDRLALQAYDHLMSLSEEERFKRFIGFDSDGFSKTDRPEELAEMALVALSRSFAPRPGGHVQRFTLGARSVYIYPESVGREDSRFVAEVFDLKGGTIFEIDVGLKGAKRSMDDAAMLVAQMTSVKAEKEKTAGVR